MSETPVHGRYFKDMYVTISSSNCITSYPVFMPAKPASLGYAGRDEVNCIEDIQMTCGQAQPFPSVEIVLRKQRIETYYPFLLDDLKVGRNVIKVNVNGTGTFILSKVKTSGNDVTLVGWSPYEIFKSVAFTQRLNYNWTHSKNGSMDVYSHEETSPVVHSPLSLLIYCMTSNMSAISGISLEISTDKIFVSPSILCDLQNSDDNDTWVSKAILEAEGLKDELGTFNITFDQSLSIWQVMTICAAALGAKVYFIDDRAYIIDPYDNVLPQQYSTFQNDISNNYHTMAADQWVPEEKSYLSMKQHMPEFPTAAEKEFTSRVVSVPSLGNEGSETVYNYHNVTCNVAADDGSATDTKCNGFSTSCTDVMNYSNTEAWRSAHSGAGAFCTYPVLNGSSDADISNQGSRQFYGICSTTIELPCTCWWSGDTEDSIRDEPNAKNPFVRLLSAKQNMRLCDDEQSVGFKYAESYMTDDGEMYWEPHYWMAFTRTYRLNQINTTVNVDVGPVARVEELVDHVSGTRVSNRMNFGDRRLPGKLQLSKMTYSFPAMYTEYWFGIIDPCTFSADLSKIVYKTV